MKKTLITVLLIVGTLYSVDFNPKTSDKNWNYLFDSYNNKSLNGAGIKSENIATPQFTVSEEILNTFLYALPEGSKANIAHPEYFPSIEPDILIQEEADAFVTFYSEGAGYRNTLGYYTYEGDTGRTEPQSRQELQKNGTIIFPNVSFTNSGGELTYGLSVSLGKLSAGTKVIFL